MVKKDISIIIVAYNSENTIGECIESVIATTKKNAYEIIVSDNSQNNLTEREVKKLQERNNSIVFIKNAKNYGFSKANNIALKEASGEFILFLNPDTIVYKDTIDGMLEFVKKTQDLGAATCFVELPDKKLDDSSHRGFPTPWNSFCYFSGLSKAFQKTKLFGGYNLSYLNFKKTHKVDSLAGSFMMMPRVVGEKLNWWDEDFFFYGEDLDFCYRIKKAGYEIYFVPEYRALHLKGISSGIKKVSKDTTQATEETKKLATYHRFNAMKIFYKKHYENKYSKFLNSFVYLAIYLKQKFA